jgi:HAD superfamily hydrolase (TIGR01490 family)
MPLEKFRFHGELFAKDILPGLVRPKAMKEIETLQAAGAEVVIVSASSEWWIGKWCQSVNLKLIATELEVAEGKITGNICGLNCHGNEKVRRIREAFDLSEYKEIYCYGDTIGDKPLLSLATIAFYKPFR